MSDPALSVPVSEKKAKLHVLAVAPPESRCNQEFEYEDGTTERCTRWVVAANTDHPEKYCVGHSTSRRAKAARSRGAKKKDEARHAETQRRVEIYNQYIGQFRSAPTTQAEVDSFRHLITQWLLLGDVTPAQARELRSMAADMERALHRAALRRAHERVAEAYGADVRCAKQRNDALWGVQEKVFGPGASR